MSFVSCVYGELTLSPPITQIVSLNFTTANALNSHQVSSLVDIAFDHGFDRCALTSLEVPSRDQAAYDQWLARGAYAGMEYMARHVEERKHPLLLFPSFRSVMSLGVSYYQGELPADPGPTFGRVARYAWGLDYHDVIRHRIAQFMSEAMSILGNNLSWTWATDSRPLLERSYAAGSGMGFVGKNTMLIVPRMDSGFHVGSYLFLSEILLPLSVECHVPKADIEKSNDCGGCSSCLTSCPTQAFEGPFFLSSKRCISYLTIENKNEIPEELRPALGHWIFGCDVCQDVCPFNARAGRSKWPEFNSDQGMGAWLSLAEVLSIADDSAFKRKFIGTPLLRAKRRGLLRNACVVAANRNAVELKPYLEKCRFDKESLIRDHAEWALQRLS